jgi:hypothetical protein
VQEGVCDALDEDGRCGLGYRVDDEGNVGRLVYHGKYLIVSIVVILSLYILSVLIGF